MGRPRPSSDATEERAARRPTAAGRPSGFDGIPEADAGQIAERHAGQAGPWTATTSASSVPSARKMRTASPTAASMPSTSTRRPTSRVTRPVRRGGRRAERRSAERVGQKSGHRRSPGRSPQRRPRPRPVGGQRVDEGAGPGQGGTDLGVDPARAGLDHAAAGLDSGIGDDPDAAVGERAVGGRRGRWRRRGAGGRPGPHPRHEGQRSGEGVGRRRR